MDPCWKCEYPNVPGAKFCASCGTSQARRPTLKSSMPTEYEQSAIDPAAILGPAAIPGRPSMVPEQPIGVGSQVLVQWSDGNRYPGAVQQLAPGYCLVAFGDGQQHWIDARLVSRP